MGIENDVNSFKMCFWVILFINLGMKNISLTHLCLDKMAAF